MSLFEPREFTPAKTINSLGNMQTKKENNTLFNLRRLSVSKINVQFITGNDVI